MEQDAGVLLVWAKAYSSEGDMSDRTVHASWAQMDVVRYDRSGKWYLEPRDTTLPRQHITVQQAADYAVWAEENRDGLISFGLPGGGRFDRLLGPAQ